MDLKLKNKTAFISGSTAGIGLAIAEALLKENAAVIINGRTAETVKQVVSDLKLFYPDRLISGIAADFSKDGEVEHLLDQLPHVDILVNNVGIFEAKPFSEIPDEDWFRFFNVNVMSGVRLSRQVMPGMFKQNWGRIIFISSESGIFIPER